MTAASTGPPDARAIVVVGDDGGVVAAEVARLRAEGIRVAGFVGTDEEEARAMGAELFAGHPLELRHLSA